jgi:hypothetical protein
MYYYPQQPPYVLLVVGFFAALASGAALAGTLKLIVQKWQNDGAQSSGSRIAIRNLSVQVLRYLAFRPYLPMQLVYQLLF